jgi:hypothetical protein
MVEIINHRDLEMQERVRANKLVEIARKELGDKFEIKISSTNNIIIHSKSRTNDAFVESRDDKNYTFISILSHPNFCNMVVDNGIYHDSAVKLAGAYERAGHGKVTLEIHYPDDVDVN